MPHISLVFREVFWMVAAGLVAGMFASVLSANAIASQLFAVQPLDIRVFAATIASSLAFAAEPAKADAKPAAAPAAAPAAEAKPAGENPMANWKPKKVTKKDTKGIDALYAAADEVW